jgi:hypothetical protein
MENFDVTENSETSDGKAVPTPKTLAKLLALRDAVSNQVDAYAAGEPWHASLEAAWADLDTAANELGNELAPVELAVVEETEEDEEYR